MTHDPHFQNEHQEASWISMTDLFLLTAVLLIAGICQLGLGISRKDQQLSSLLVQSTIDANKAKEIAAQLETALAEVSRLKPLTDASDSAKEAQRIVEELRKRLQAVEGESATGKVTVEELQRHITELQASARKAEGLALELSDSRAKEQRLTAEVARLQPLQPTIDALRGELAAANARISTLVRDVSTARVAKDRSDAAFVQYRSSQGAISQELLGFTGKMDRAVFIFDGSGSMTDDGRWNATRATMRAWLRALPVQEAAIIVFNDNVKAVPDGTTLLPLTTPNLALFEDTLEKTRPEGNTKTLNALQRAYRFEPIDAIVLFTDGAPEDPEKVRRFVKEMHSRFPQTRIHAVGIGDYFNKNFGGFLKDMASQTGGTFIGR